VARVPFAMARKTPKKISSAILRLLALFTLALPGTVAHGSPTTLRKKLVKIGAKVVRYGRTVIFLVADVTVPRRG
jgi:hypothetical protein